MHNEREVRHIVQWTRMFKVPAFVWIPRFRARSIFGHPMHVGYTA